MPRDPQSESKSALSAFVVGVVVGSWAIRKFRVSRMTARLAGFRARTRPWMMRGTDIYSPWMMSVPGSGVIGNPHFHY